MYNSSGIVFAEKPSIGIEPTRLFDSSRHKNHGTHTNITMVQLPSGLWVRQFDETSYIIHSSVNIKGAVDFTIIFWYKPTSFANYHTLIANAWEGETNNIVGIYLGVSGLLTGQYYDDGYTAVEVDNVLNTGILYMISLVNLGGNLTIYTNTTPSTTAGGGHSIGSENRLVIGANNAAVISDKTNGIILIPRILNYPLSAGQIKKIVKKQRIWFNV